ncbi:hypothetical protein ABZY09_28775 [Streptomyces sp. NPDC002928]|uniref:hypothetical protein n=1 Tax=Streptomyces sp. NPDC002928 TaxID=3154440 RepID=UPI0033BE9370
MLLIIGGAVVVVGLVGTVVASLVEGGGGDRTVHSPPFAVNSASAFAFAEARAVAERLPLSPADWGSGFMKDSTLYELSPVNETEVGSDCRLTGKLGRPGTLTTLRRSVTNTDDGVIGNSEARVYRDAATAQRYVDDVADNIHRCPSQTDGKLRWSGVREATPPRLTGFDVLLSEEGRQVADMRGLKTDFPYVVLTGRLRNTVMSVYVNGQQGSEQQIRTYAQGGLALMRSRLQEPSDTASS